MTFAVAWSFRVVRHSKESNACIFEGFGVQEVTASYLNPDTLFSQISWYLVLYSWYY